MQQCRQAQQDCKAGCRVTRAGEPAAGVALALIPVEPMRAAGVGLGDAASALYERPLRALVAPPAETQSSADGTFVLPLADAGHAGHHLVATDQHGTRRVVPVARGQRELDVELFARGFQSD